MKTKISTFIAAAVLLLIGTTATLAQGTNVYFNKNGATVFQTPISNIDSIIFKQEIDYNYVAIDWDANIITNYDENTGEITLQCQDTLPAIEEYNVIVLPQQYGYDIRVITSYSVSGKTLIIETEQGDMTNLFKNTSFTLSTDPSLITNSLQTRSDSPGNVITPSEIGIMTASGYKKVYDRSFPMRAGYDDSFNIFSLNRDFSGTDLYNKSGRQRVYWDKGIFDVGLKGVFSFDFSDTVANKIHLGNLKKFEFYLDGNLNIDLLLKYVFSDQIKEEPKENLMIPNILPSMVFTFMVGPVPIYITVNTDLYSRYELNANAEISLSAGCNLQAEAKMGLTYIPPANVSPIGSFSSSFTPYYPTFNAQGSLAAKGSIYPKINLSIYKFADTWVEPMPYLREDFEGGMQASMDGNNYLGWTSKSYAGMDYRMGLNFAIFNKNMNLWTSDVYNLKDALLLDAPNKIKLVSPAEGTTITPGTLVNVSFYVSFKNNITGNDSLPCFDAFVNFSTQGNLDKWIAASDAQGLATVQWTPKDSNDKLTATIVDKNGKTVNEATFTPTYDDSNPPDVDDNGLTDSIDSIVPPDILEKFQDLGVNINGGNTPPFIEGTYLMSPMRKVRSNFFEWGYPTLDREMAFYNQDVSNLTIRIDTRSFNLQGFIDNSETTSEGIGSFIAGHDNAFSVFAKMVGSDEYGNQYEMVSVFSGELVNGGIRNWQEASIMVDDHGDPRNIWIENGQGRLWIDGDGFSERINNPNQSPPLRKASIQKSLPSMLKLLKSQ